MTLKEFQAGPGREFSPSLRLSTSARRVFLGRAEREFLAEFILFRVGVKVPIEIVVEFSDGRLATIRLGFQARGGIDEERIYSTLREELLRTYAVGRSGPVYMDQQKAPRRWTLLLLDSQGNSAFLQVFLGGDSVTLVYEARGVLRGYGADAARVILGRFPRFCESPGGN